MKELRELQSLLRPSVRRKDGSRVLLEFNGFGAFGFPELTSS
jgi:hypothetical protein